MKRIGMLTSGGDCQALNATMRGVVKGLCNMYKDDIEVYGFLEGYKGLIRNNYKLLKAEDFSGILTKGGTILGSSRQPFKLMDQPTEDGINKVKAMKETYKKLKLECLVVLGGNGSQKTANLLSEEGLNVIGLPKTIDNDLWGTDMTFGFQSAVDIATQAIDCIHTTAASHNRVFVVEIMGHKVGHITLHAGIAGGADIILLPEIPYDIKSVCKALDKRSKAGKGFSIINDYLLNYNAGSNLLTSSHSDLVRMAIEVGILFFTFWVIYYLYMIPKRLKRMTGNENVAFVSLLCFFFVFITYFIDNTLELFAVQTMCMMVPIGLYKREEKMKS